MALQTHHIIIISITTPWAALHALICVIGLCTWQCPLCSARDQHAPLVAMIGWFSDFYSICEQLQQLGYNNTCRFSHSLTLWLLRRPYLTIHWPSASGFTWLCYKKRHTHTVKFNHYLSCFAIRLWCSLVSKPLPVCNLVAWGQGYVWCVWLLILCCLLIWSDTLTLIYTSNELTRPRVITRIIAKIMHSELFVVY